MYNFQSLSPLDFEELVRDLLQAELGVRFESFGPGPDQGIDFRAARSGGMIIVQAKHYERSGAKALLSALRTENDKLAAMSKRPRRYILATSVSLSPKLKGRIVAALPDAPLGLDDIFGQEDLNNLLGRHDKIEQKHFKLWLASTPILERILLSGIYNRTQTEMALIRDMVPRFVQNKSVEEAEAILSKSGALIIAGEPGVGKTTLARMLVWLHAAQEWKIFVVDDIKEAFDVANEGEKRLIFFDDFLGQVRLSADLVRGMDQRLPPFFERVRANKNLRFILTTRDYIFSQAQLISQRLSGKALDTSRYVLDVGTYTRGARARILYNHLYFSDLDNDQREALLEDAFYLEIIDHDNFNPRLIETLTSADYADVSTLPIREAVKSILDNPQELWERPYRNHISDEGKALMLALLLNSHNVPVMQLQYSFVRMVTALELPIAKSELKPKFRSALRELEGSIAAIENQHVRFANPGVRDFLQRTFVEDDLLPTVIESIETYNELRQCWVIWNTEEASSQIKHKFEKLWVEAIDRMQAAESGFAVDRLGLAIDIYDKFRTQDPLERVRAAINLFDQAGLDGRQIQNACSALENSSLSLLPAVDSDRVRSVLTEKTAEMVKEFASEFNLDEIEALDIALHEYGFDKDVASEAVHSALDSFTNELDQHLYNINSVDDLDVFEAELKRLMERRDYTNFSAEWDISVHRERLYEEDRLDDSEGYSGRSGSSINEMMTTDEIHSMFAGISKN